MAEALALTDEALRLPLLGSEASSVSISLAHQGATLMQTCANLVNIFIGLGLLSMPFALMKGGWVALGALGVLVPLFGGSGQLICAAFDLMPPGQPRTYPALGAAAAGRLGSAAVLLFSCCELFGATLVTLMISWQMLELLLPSEGIGPLHPQHLAAALSCVVLLPLLCIDLRRLSRFSLLGGISTALVVCLVLGLLALDPRRAAMPQQPPPGHHLASWGILQAVGIFALSCSAHTTLPALRSSMAKPSRFPLALAASFAAMFACYAAVAAAGYWYWGDAASPLAIADLAANSWYSTASLPVDRLLAALVMVSGLTKFPALVMVLQDLVLSAAPPLRDSLGNARPPPLWVERALRFALACAAAALALTAYSALGSVLSLVGGLCSLTCSLLLPTAFYTRLVWPRLAWPLRAASCLLLAASLALIAVVTATNVAELAGARSDAPAPLAGAAAMQGATSAWGTRALPLPFH